jgi:serine/threonine protein kinase
VKAVNRDPLTCDPTQIELFLLQQLTDEEQMAFESHLEVCDDCRHRLETTAAKVETWQGVRDSLQRQPSRPKDQSSASSPQTASQESEPPFDHRMVLRLLSPTDDDRMMGRWGTYEVVGLIGSGGMGIVLKALDTALNRYVAIKILAPHLGSSGAARKRFSREAQAAAAVVHDNVIEIYGVADEGGLPYLVMPYVRGPSLQRRLDQDGPLALVEILRIAIQSAAGLAAAHAQGLVHRDVKPANILLADGVERVKLTDFGLACAADDASLTKSGIIAGTPQYMSPEQARGELVDQRSDLFSLGSVLYAMCTARAPFRAETSYGILQRITDEDPRPIREINPDIPEWLCHVVARLMAKHPDERFETAREVANLLGDCLVHVQQPTAVPLPSHGALRGASGDLRVSPAGRKANGIRRWPTFTRLVGVALALSVVGASALVMMKRDQQKTAGEGNTPAQATGLPDETAAIVATSHFEVLSGYRDYLWGELRSLEHQRSRLLFAITGEEQRLIELKQAPESPTDPSHEAEMPDEGGQERHARMIAGLSNRLKVLRDELLGLEPRIAFVRNKLEELPPHSAEDLALFEPSMEPFIGQDAGEPIYNDRLKRFKFRLDRIPVTGTVETAQEFWIQYRHRGNPPITGVWGDPRTNSLIIVGPPDAEQPIRDTIAAWEGAQLGIDLDEDDSLEGQSHQYQNQRRTLLETIAQRRIELIDARSRSNPNSQQIRELEQKLLSETTELEIAEQKLNVVRDGLERLQKNEP